MGESRKWEVGRPETEDRGPMTEDGGLKKVGSGMLEARSGKLGAELTRETGCNPYIHNWIGWHPQKMGDGSEKQG
jgi:hypothetical protein